MGDDAIELYSEYARKVYEEMGFEVKEYIECSKQDFEFCSYRFKGDKQYACNIVKPLHNLLNQKNLNQNLIVDFINTYRGHPDIKHVLSLLNASLAQISKSF